MALDELNQLHQRMRSCRLCFDDGYQITPGAVFSGGNRAKAMIIGQAPGATEVTAQRPFNAGSGRRLFKWLNAAGWEEDEFRRTQYMTAVTKCYPGKNSSGRGDRVPSKAEQALCRQYLADEIRLIAPRLIVPVGGLAIRLFYQNSSKLNEVIGTALYSSSDSTDILSSVGLIRASITKNDMDQFPEKGTWIVPLPHPSGASVWPNKPENQQLIDSAIEYLRIIRNVLYL